MDLKDLAVAMQQIMENEDSEKIKYILRRGYYDEYIFSEATYDSDGITYMNLPQLLYATGTENFLILLPWYGECCDALGNILLRVAAQISDYELTKLLLEKGADVASTDEEGRTALHIACDRKSLEIVKLLTQKSPGYILDATQDNGDTPLDRACRRSCPEIVQFLLSQGSSVFINEDREKGPLLNAVFNKVEYAISIVSMLLDAGANINHCDKFGNTALLYAAHLSALELCPEEQSSVGTAFAGYLGWREKRPKIDLITLLIERGSDVNAVGVRGRCALHWAVISTQESFVRKLIVSGSDMDKRDEDGFTPLYYACQKGSKRLVELLIISGADLRAQNWQVSLRNFENATTSELLNYVIYESTQCLDLKNLCYILLRKKLRYLEKDAFQLGLPQFLIKGLLLKNYEH